MLRFQFLSCNKEKFKVFLINPANMHRSLQDGAIFNETITCFLSLCPWALKCVRFVFNLLTPQMYQHSCQPCDPFKRFRTTADSFYSPFYCACRKRLSLVDILLFSLNLYRFLPGIQNLPYNSFVFDAVIISTLRHTFYPRGIEWFPKVIHYFKKQTWYIIHSGPYLMVCRKPTLSLISSGMVLRIFFRARALSLSSWNSGSGLSIMKSKSHRQGKKNTDLKLLSDRHVNTHSKKLQGRLKWSN